MLNIPKGYTVELDDDGGWSINKGRYAVKFWLNPSNRKKAWKGLRQELLHIRMKAKNKK